MMTFKRILISSAVLASLTLSGCVIHVNTEDGFDSRVTSILGDVSVSSGKVVSEVSSVNGDVFLEDNVKATSVSTVNGDIKTAEDVTIDSISTVNGDIKGGENLLVLDSIATVNGDLKLMDGSRIEGPLDTVNGDVKLTSTRVTQTITSKNGDVVLRDGSTVEGDIVFKFDNDKYSRSKPKLVIDETSAVEGQIVLYRDVELKIDNPQVREKVVFRGGE